MFNSNYKDLLDKLNSGEETVLLTYMKSINEKSGSITNKVSLTKDDIDTKFSSLGKKKDLHERVYQVLDSGSPQLFNNQGDEMILIEPFFPKPRLIIFGGGHIAKPLSEFGDKVGFTIAIIDDRPFFANSNRFPEASQVICEDFENSFNLLQPNKTDFMVIVTRGHRHDETCLRKTLNYNPAYIGMIGSKRRVQDLKNKLIQEGYSTEELNRVNTPIGLDIGAITPEEIAISIIAEVISFRRRNRNKGSSKTNKGFNWPEFDLEVMQEIVKEKEDPKALATIISTKGSVPRKAGAKMIVYPDGRTIGSIGGGCSEAAVITVARDVILNKGYIIQHVDMTGDIAEEEGMVCGGTMEVLIESL
ncbi:MAG: XdhC family protein [Clostridiaceae bacterium]|nr:XdhC family protein [Clostridiaceae bacterium]